MRQQQWLTTDEAAFLQQCRATHTRRQGPGGQHRNKVATAIVLRHLPTDIQAEASERRSQAENLRQAVSRLRRLIALECRAPVTSAGYQPTELWLQRTAHGRLTVNLNHADFAPLLAESLDCLAASGWVPASAAQLLQVSSSQLVRFIQQDLLAGQLVNRHRFTLGLKPLK